jgi:Flp pilus assembly protein TadG
MPIRHVRRFLADRRGNVAPIFALSLIPLIGLIGTAVDYTRASATRAAMQSDLDSTALAMASKAATMTQSQIEQEATTYFNSLFNRTDTSGVTITSQYNTDNGPQLILTAATTVKTTFMSIHGIGIDSVPVSVQSTTKWGNSRLRVALALDNTGSMQQNSKMTYLKQAAKALIDQLSAAATVPEDVYVSIVPFAKDVKVATADRNAAWIDWTYWDTSSATDTFGTCSNPNYSRRSTCTAAGTCTLSQFTTQSTCTGAGTCSNAIYNNDQSNCTGRNACSDSRYTTRTTCQNAGKVWGRGTWTSANAIWTAETWTPDHTKWTGCVMDRGDSNGPNANNYDANDLAPALSGGTDPSKFPAEQYTDCPGLQELLPLSNNWTTLKNKIDAMTPNGNTNTTIGLEWGWHSLTQSDPLNAPPEDTAHYTYNKVIIFLTDGTNTQNRWSSTESAIDARMTLACQNAKALVNGKPGVTIYTILVLQGNATLLQNCASGLSNYFNITASNQLVTVFNQIGTQLSQLHVAK